MGLFALPAERFDLLLTTVVGVRFKKVSKMYYFNPGKLNLRKGAAVIIDTQNGLECGICITGRIEVEDEKIVPPLRRVIRTATQEDLDTMVAKTEKEKKAIKICKLKAAAHNLEMKIIDAEYSFDGGKIIFYFTADGRVDFRNLVKDLAAAFHTRIELRQIGVRDEARVLGGVGICGKGFCCSGFLDDFQPVSIKMAKEQNLSLNPTKISGTCGRLMCCLKYEQSAYEHLRKTTPRQGNVVSTPHGQGVVTDVFLIKGDIKVRLDDAPESPPKTIPANECKVVRSGKSMRVPADDVPEGEES